MPKYSRSLQEIKSQFLEDMGCASCGGMSAGDGGFSGDASPEGPVAGFDPAMGKIDKIRKKRKTRIPQR